MARGSFPTSPGATGEQRKFINPTGGFVGANIFGPDGKPTSIPVEPGGEVWLTPEEERMTAEAPRLSQDNPFVKEWEEPVEFDSFGEVVRTVTRHGVLTLSDDPPRPVASDRFIPESTSAEGLRATREAMEGLTTPSDVELREREEALTARETALKAREAELAAQERNPGSKPAEPQPPAEETVKGADVPEPTQPAPQGQPSPDEIVGTPDAVAANDEALAQRQPTREQPVAAGGIPT